VERIDPQKLKIPDHPIKAKANVEAKFSRV
jgi:hypothetical protein